MPQSPYEYWYAAQAAYDAGDYERAIANASEGLAHHPLHGGLNYQLACFHALAGHPGAATRCLGVAYQANPRTRAWAETDHDLAREAAVRRGPAAARSNLRSMDARRRWPVTR
jgi:tetratricopeptide (TPR) repeat protein